MMTISAEEISTNIDLLTEILLRLPSKPLVSFKCVSKQWLSLISDPQFSLSHTRHHLTPTALLLKRNYPIPETIIFPLKQNTIPKVPFFHDLNSVPFFYGLDSPNFRIRQSCNGLLLFSVLKYREVYSYYICNPTTKQFKTLPFPSSEFQESLVSVCMAFHPLKSKHYKLICIRTVKDKKIYQMDMYSSETNSWGPLGITFTSPTRMDYAKPVFCNGVVHWFIEEKVETSLYFDVDKECLKRMPIPNSAERKIQYFGESQGCLHLIVTKHLSPLQFDVLEMAPDYSGWFVKYHVDLDAVKIVFPDIIWHDEDKDKHIFSVLHVIRAQKEEESIVVLLVNTKAISYNVHNGALKNLGSTRISGYKWSDTFQYFDILTSV